MPRKTSLADFQNSVMRRVRRRIRPRLVQEALQRFLIAKQQLLADIEAHPISQELRNFDSPSKFLNGGKGTLYGFLGFPAGTDPVGELTALVDNAITFEAGRTWSNNILPVFIQFLGTEDLKKLTPLPWQSSLPWPVVIETFTLSPLVSRFLEARDRSLGISRLGIQSKNQVRNASFKNTQYLTPIFEDFRENIVRGRI